MNFFILYLNRIVNFKMSDAVIRKKYVELTLSVFIRHFRKYLKIKKPPKEKGYYKLITEDEQRYSIFLL